ncbi:hypothetical protein MTR67_043161 [Solanum verrucosum]|uniref:Uncharacterized protein n=1 Tax=Solanum verrucosum TaxID=315347 RepID=A0AAF0UQU5_SOLVR|nr:hypothetical protein MTR67_043161 [Solanum verrucosum]
MALYRETVR